MLNMLNDPVSIPVSIPISVSVSDNNGDALSARIGILMLVIVYV